MHTSIRPTSEWFDRLQFGNNYKEEVTAKADWTRTATTRPVLTPVPVGKWAVIFFERNKTEVQRFCKTLIDQGESHNVKFEWSNNVSTSA